MNGKQNDIIRKIAEIGEEKRIPKIILIKETRLIIGAPKYKTKH